MANTDNLDQNIIYNELEKIEQQLSNNASADTLKVSDEALHIMNKYTHHFCLLTDLIECTDTSQPYKKGPVLYLYLVFIVDLKKGNICFYDSCAGHTKIKDLTLDPYPGSTMSVPLRAIIRKVRKQFYY